MPFNGDFNNSLKMTCVPLPLSKVAATGAAAAAALAASGAAINA